MRKKTTEELVQDKPAFDRFVREKKHPINVILNNVRSLQNVGLCFRICDALKAQKLYLTGYTGHPPLEKNDPRPANIIIHAKNQIEKTAIRSVNYVPWEYQEDVLELLANLKKKNFQIIAVEQTHGSLNYLEADYNFPLALVFGHEREGVDNSVLRLSDFAVEIPMYGMGNSLNVATSLAILGYELIKRT